jgi:serine/threonine protein kinase
MSKTSGSSKTEARNKNTSPTRFHSKASLDLQITPNNELCWEKQLGGTALSRTFRVRCPVNGLVAIKMINIQLIAEIRGLTPTRIWKEMMAEIALANSFPEKCPHILGFYRLTTNVPRTCLYAWKLLEGMSLARFAFAEERHIMQATKFRRFSYLIHRYMLQVCEALAVIHEEGLVHGGVRLENVCLERLNDGEELEECANIKLTDPIISRNVPFDTPSSMVYWSPEMCKGIDTGGILKMTHVTAVTIPSENYMMGLLIVELVTARRLTEISLAPISLQPTLIKAALKSARGTCPLLADVATELLYPHWKRITAADAADKLRSYVLEDKMHVRFEGKDPLLLRQLEEMNSKPDKSFDKPFDPFDDSDEVNGGYK